MKKINIRRLVYHVRNNYLTLNNVVIAVAFLIAVNWVWGSLQMMERNYNLQKEVDFKKKQLQLTQLETTNLSLQQRYYRTTEYQELAARQSLNLVRPGEKVLILPPNSAAAKAADAPVPTTAIASDSSSNIEQWVNFLFGGYSKSIADE